MTPFPLPDNIASLDPYVPGKPISEVERELGLSDSVKLASNENPLGPSPKALEAARRALSDAHRYPDGSGWHLRETLGRLHGVPMDQIVLGNGSTDLVEILARTFLGRDGSAVMADQAFIMYRLAAMAVNGGARPVPLTAMRHDLRAMAAAVDAGTRLVFIANPNNPTGTHVTRSELGSFLDSIPPDVLVVVDEAYHEYVMAEDYPDAVDWVREGRRLAVLRTFSKAHGLAGLRLGYAVTTAEVRGAVERVRSPFNTNSVAQAAALAALDDTAHVARAREHNAREMAFLEESLRRLGVQFTPSVGNFVLVDTARDGDDLFARLLRRGVIVRPMRAYGLPSCLRVTVGTRRENGLFLQALAQELGLAISRAG